MKKHSGQFRRLTALALALCMLAALTAEIFAADIVDSGYCGGEGDGKNLTWTLDSEMTLTISGKGKMADFDNHDKASYSYGELQPWRKYTYRLRKLVLGRGITSIGAEAFCGGTTTLWQELEIPDGVVSIGNHAFSTTFYYGTLKIPDSVVSIGDQAFYSCGNFTGSLTIPDSVVSIGKYAFYNCTGFSGDLIIGNGVLEIGESAFDNCGFSGSLTIGNSVSTIGRGAFVRSKFTGSLNIPDSVTYIGNSAFEQCTAFDGDLTIGVGGSGNTTIGAYAFEDCTGFKGRLNIGNSVKGIGFCAFRNCSGLMKFQFRTALQALKLMHLRIAVALMGICLLAME